MDKKMQDELKNELSKKYGNVDVRLHEQPSSGFITVYMVHRDQYRGGPSARSYYDRQQDMLATLEQLRKDGLIQNPAAHYHGGSPNSAATRAARAGGWAGKDLYDNCPTIHFPAPGQTVQRQTVQTLAEENAALKAMLAKYQQQGQGVVENTVESTEGGSEEIPF